MRRRSVCIAALLSLAGSSALQAPALAQPSCVAPPSGLVGWWPLEETSGTAVADRSPSQNGGTATGAIGPAGNPKSVTGYVGKGFNFYFGQRVNVPPSASLNFGQSFTIDAWIKGNSAPIIGNLATGGQNGFYLFHASSNGKLAFQIGDGTTVLGPFYGQSIAPNDWTFVAVTVDLVGRTVTFNTGANGTMAAPITVAIPPAANAVSGLPLQIGGCPGNPNGCNAIIDEVEVFNRALQQNEIKSIFDADSAGKCVRKGMTWTHVLSNPVSGTITVGCRAGLAPADQCNAYVGDTVCTVSRPMLCIYGGKTSANGSGLFSVVPPGVNNSSQYNRWSGGVVATTAPVPASTFANFQSRADADQYCVSSFGAGWRMAEFHDGWGWNFQAYGGTTGAPQTSSSDRFWVYIKNQPANCF